jgi:translation initiation factor IF-2
MLQPEEKLTVVGKAEVRAVFKIPKIGNIAGCRVVSGEIHRNGFIHVLRQNAMIYDGSVNSLKHEKDDVREVREGFECGIGVKGFTDFQEGDILECYTREMVKPE